MNIVLDRGSPVPLRDQIVAYFESQIRLGVFAGGMRLPSVRSLASQIRVNPSTVREAYAELNSRDMVQGQHGRGTYVRVGRRILTTRPDAVEFDEQDWNRSLVYTTMVAPYRENVLSLDQQVPTPDLLPLADIELATRHIWRPGNRSLHGFGDPQGLLPLRERIIQLLAWRGVTHLGPDLVLITNGVVQGLYLCLSLLCHKGDGVIVESPTWGVALAMLNHLGLAPRPVPITPDGIDVDAVEEVLRQGRARSIFTVPCGHNPTGITSSTENRQALLEVARRYGVPLIEDDVYGLLGLSGEEPPSLLAFDENHETVFSMTGLSKSLGPALRIGAMAVPRRYRDRFIAAKQNIDLHASHLVQHVAERYLALGRFETQLQRMRESYCVMREERLASLDEILCHRVRITPPAGGFALWLQLPPGISSRALVAETARHGVYATPGPCFFPLEQERDGDPYLRLSLTQPAHREFRAALRTIRMAIDQYVPSPTLQ